MESDLYGIYSLVVFVSEIELVSAANVRTRGCTQATARLSLLISLTGDVISSFKPKESKSELN